MTKRGAKFIDAPETMDQAGAERIKAMIEGYWRSRGFEVHVWLEETSFGRVVPSATHMEFCRYAIRSNLINGAPQPAASP